jgi:hypothetical protein
LAGAKLDYDVFAIEVCLEFHLAFRDGTNGVDSTEITDIYNHGFTMAFQRWVGEPLTSLERRTKTVRIDRSRRGEYSICGDEAG